MKFTLANARVLLADGSLEETEVAVEDGRIAAFGAGVGRSRMIDLGGRLLLPGIVDLHGDAFERAIMPRSGVAFPLDIALDHADRAVLASGITTAYLAQGVGWESGLRGAGTAEKLLSAVEAGRPRFGADLRFHVRFEIYAFDAAEQVCRWLEDGRAGMLVFNDHLPQFEQELASDPAKLENWVRYIGLTMDAFRAKVREMRAAEADARACVGRVAAAARRAGVPTGSHDDDTAELRRRYHDLGATVAEFPVNLETARAAAELGNPVGMGAPNVLRGGSASGNVAARELIAEGLCDYLISDYYYPAQLHAAFKLVREGTLKLGQAWSLVSAAPARVGGLPDRGAIEVGRRADLIAVDDGRQDLPILSLAMVEGRIAYGSGGFGLLAEPATARA